MGRQAYMTRLALGRSAWELPEEGSIQATEGQPHQGSTANADSNGLQQRYNRRGYPVNSESRGIARTSRRAQNDVLSTVGFCVGIREDGSAVDTSLTLAKASKHDKEKIESVRKENEAGLLIGAASHGIMFLGIWWILALRIRLQTFSSYSGFTLAHIIKAERKTFGLVKFLFAGCPALMAHLLVGTGCEFLYYYCLRLSFYLLPSQSEKFLSLSVKSLVDIGRFLLESPLQIFSILQVLDLIPAGTLFPHPRSLLPYSRHSLLQLPLFPTRITATSLFAFASSAINSPAFLLWVFNTVSRSTEQVLFNYFRTTLPKPDNPDIYSVQAAQLDKHDHEMIAGLEPPREAQHNGGFTATLLPDFRRMGNRLLKVFGFGGKENTGEPADSELQPTVTQDDIEPPTANEEGQHEEQGRNVEDPELALASPTPSEGIGRPESRMDHPTYPDPTINDHNTHEPSPPPAEHDSISSFSEGPSPDPEPITDSTPVRVSNRRRDTDTVTMEVEISGRPPNVQLRGRPLLPSTPSAEALLAGERTAQVQPLLDQHRRESRQVDSKEPTHRVTLLSNCMADVLATLLAQCFSDLICLPLQAQLVRAVALGFLAAAGPTSFVQTSALGLRKAVYPVNASFGLGLRGAGWRGVGDYATKMMLCSALEAAVGYGVWQVGATTCFWVGRKWFDWGRL